MSINALDYFQVFYYLVWVVRIFEDLDSPSSPFLDHFLLCSTISVASIQSYRPTIKNQIFHKFMILHPMVLFSRYRLNTANDLAQFLVQRLCLKCPRIYRPGMIDIILLYLFKNFTFLSPFTKFLVEGPDFIPWFYIVNMVSTYHFTRSNLPWRNLIPAHTPFFLYLELNKSAASAWLVTACFYSISGHRDCI